jgi:hypothetical protein
MAVGGQCIFVDKCSDWIILTSSASSSSERARSLEAGILAQPPGRRANKSLSPIADSIDFKAGILGDEEGRVTRDAWTR